jgi:DNA-binding beta-propeller fold protein YncE
MRKTIKIVGLLLAGALFIPHPLSAAAQTGKKPGKIPSYRVDADWPHELPNNWILGQVGGMTVDHQNHLWVLQRPRTVPEVALGRAQNPPTTACCITAPAVLEFGADGKVMRSWGGPGFIEEWPDTEHGIHVDGGGNVWITGNGRTDRLVIKFSPEGKHLLTIGKKSDAPLNNQDVTMLGRPSGLTVDDSAHEVFIADGYLNSRVMVFDSETGAFKRGWGAYGAKLEEIANTPRAKYTPGQPPAKQLNLVHCLALSKDGLIYICDRTNDRIQVFAKDGRFVSEFVVHPETQGMGSVVNLGFSADPDQKFLIAADDGNSMVRILDRKSGAEVSQFGHRGHNAGQFEALHQLAVDANGVIYTGEAGGGMRIQKFVPH